MTQSDLPTLLVECAFTTRPTEAPAWVDVTASVRGFSCSRGRRSERDSMQTGTGSVRLDNRDRRFDPAYTAGPYYGNLKRRRRVRIRATWAGVTYDVFTGYAERWPQTWERFADAYVDVPLVDGLAVLALKQLNATYPEERSDLRVHRVLDAVSWTTGQSWVLDSAINSVLGTTTILGPVGDRLIGEGQSTIQAGTLADTDAIAHLRDVERSENGLLFVGKDGSVVFQGRHRRIKPPYTTSAATFGDRPELGELPYADLTLSDDTPVANEVRVARQGGATAVATDATSQLDYFPQTRALTSLVTSDAECQDAANWWLSRLKEPPQRVTALKLAGQLNPASLWPRLLEREIGDRITATRRPVSGGNAITQESFVEGITHAYSAEQGRWEMGFWLSPADTATYLILDDPTAGVLGIGRLAY